MLYVPWTTLIYSVDDSRRDQVTQIAVEAGEKLGSKAALVLVRRNEVGLWQGKKSETPQGRSGGSEATKRHERSLPNVGCVSAIVAEVTKRFRAVGEGLLLCTLVPPRLPCRDSGEG